MTPQELEAARATLGDMWRLGAPLSAADLARLMEIEARDPGARVRAWETGKTESIPGPVAAYVKALLAGFVPEGAPKGTAAPMAGKADQKPPARIRRRR